MPCERVVCFGGEGHKVRIKPYKGGTLAVLDGGELIDIVGRWTPGQRLLTVVVDGRMRIVQVRRAGRDWELQTHGATHKVQVLSPHVAELAKHMIDKAAARSVAASARADAGASARLDVEVGDKVEPGQPVAVMEAMKMENILRSARGGDGQGNARQGRRQPRGRSGDRRVRVIPAALAACSACHSSKSRARRPMAVAWSPTAVKVARLPFDLAGDFKLMRILSKFALLAAATMLTPPLFAAAPAAAAQSVPIPTLVSQVAIPHTTFKLKNGLTVIVHEDHKAPVAAVSVWYNVGSKDEPKGKTGFAHLFEHLMFNGSENLPGDYFTYLQQIGATDYNGTTYYDRTNYFETVPAGALERALFMESDRMGHLLGAVTQGVLDNQRGVVQNEKRQGDSRPGGLVQYECSGNLFPAGHPYHHTAIGSMADLDAASLADVKQWFRDKYGPNNAVLVVAGDVTAGQGEGARREIFRRRSRPGRSTTRRWRRVPTLARRQVDRHEGPCRDDDHPALLGGAGAARQAARRARHRRARCSAGSPARGSTRSWCATRRSRSA